MAEFKVPQGYERKFHKLTDNGGALTPASVMRYYKAKIIENVNLYGKSDPYTAAVKLGEISREASAFAPLAEDPILRECFEGVRDIALKLSANEMKEHREASSQALRQMADIYRGVIQMIVLRAAPEEIDTAIKDAARICGHAFAKFKDPEVQNIILEMLMLKNTIRKEFEKLEKKGYFN